MKIKKTEVKKFLLTLNPVTHRKISQAKWTAKTTMGGLMNHVLDATDWDAVAAEVAKK